MARVLVVDDDAAVVLALTAVLEGKGYEVAGATAARQALGLLATWKADAVICDLTMEPMDGFEFALEVSMCREWDSVRLLALSGYDDSARRFAAKQVGYEGYLTKPVSGTELDQAIRQVLDPVAAAAKVG